jgi:soluble lytic murein transglycosylase
MWASLMSVRSLQRTLLAGIVSLPVFAYAPAGAEDSPPATAPAPAAPAASQPAPAATSTPAATAAPAFIAPQNGVVMMAPIPDGSTDAVPLPSPDTPSASGLSYADRVALVQAHNAGNHGDWIAARAYAAQASDKLGQDLVTWRYVSTDGSGATFDEIDQFLRAHPKWPRHDSTVSLAERALPADMDPRAIVAWFGNRKPQTGLGAIRLGEALIATGNKDAGNAMIKKAWVSGAFTATDEALILAVHSDIITSTDHKARLERLLWAGDRDGAKREAARLDDASQQLAQSAAQMQLNPALAARVAAALPDDLRADPVIQFTQARSFRITGDDTDAWAAMLSAPPGNTVSNPEQWWNERHIMARDALKAGQANMAYSLACTHGLTAGSADWMDAEFLCGWIQLRFLNDPQKALTHFQALAHDVSYPISVARAQYWIGRAEDAMGDSQDALMAYRKAAEHSETYYGQIALAHVESQPVLHMGASTPDTTSVRAAMESDDRMRAIRQLADLGEKYLVRVFALDYVHDLKDPKQFRALADFADSTGDQSLALRVAKQASYVNVAMMDYLNPVMPVPRIPSLTAPEQALVLGLTRQESEFDPNAISQVGAMGLMQLMPASAKKTASTIGMKFNAKDLIADPQYNMKIGQAHLAGLLADWGNSYILAVAAYNAGSGNVRKWIDAYGDPRTSGVDAIDWVESIPYGETRNYVMRVLENTEVYRSRLAGGTGRLMIMADLYGPNPPRDGALAASIVPSATTPTIPVAPAIAPATPQPEPESPQTNLAPANVPTPVLKASITTSDTKPASPKIPTPLAKPAQREASR